MTLKQKKYPLLVLSVVLFFLNRWQKAAVNSKILVGMSKLLWDQSDGGMVMKWVVLFAHRSRVPVSA